LISWTLDVVFIMNSCGSLRFLAHNLSFACARGGMEKYCGKKISGGGRREGGEIEKKKKKHKTSGAGSWMVK